jgi:hypothetical protein
MPAIGGRQPISISYLDHSGETKAFRVYSGELTPASLAGFLTQMGALTAAIDGVTLGVRHRESWGEETVISNTPPASANAQVETEILVRCRGAISEAPFSFRIPTADYTAFNWVGDKAVLEGAGASASTTNLIAAIEALCKMPDDETEAVVVAAIEVVD